MLYLFFKTIAINKRKVIAKLAVVLIAGLLSVSLAYASVSVGGDGTASGSVGSCGGGTILRWDECTLSNGPNAFGCTPHGKGPECVEYQECVQVYFPL